MPSPVQQIPGSIKDRTLQDEKNYRAGRKIPAGASPFKNLVLTPVSVVDELFPENVSQQSTFTGQRQGDEQHERVKGKGIQTATVQDKATAGASYQGQVAEKDSEPEMQQGHKKDRGDSPEEVARSLPGISAQRETSGKDEPVNNTGLSRLKGGVLPPISVVDKLFPGSVPQQDPFTGKKELHDQGKGERAVDQEEDLKLLIQRASEAGLTEADKTKIIQSYKELCTVLPKSEAQKMIMWRIYRQANSGASVP